MRNFFTRQDLTRRDTLMWLARTGVAVPFISGLTAACGSSDPAQQAEEKFSVINAPGYGRDPDMLDPTIPWPLTMTEEQQALTAKLSDLFIPADDRSPAATEIGVPSFVDEWISAPYPVQAADRQLILAGLQRLAKQKFLAADEVRSEKMVQDLSDPNRNRHQDDYDFFKRFRYVTMTGYYASETGIEELGYLGNAPSETFDGPPPEVLEKLGL